MNRIVMSVVAAGLAVSACTAVPVSEPHWGYSGHTGPEYWATLAAEYGACAGKNQSPVDLTGFIEADLEPIEISYAPGGHEIVNNGHTVQVSYTAGSSMKVEGIRFDLKQFHFHAPGEHHVHGRSYPMEAHLVHADDHGNLAVLSVMYEEGAESAALGEFWDLMPRKEGGRASFSEPFDASRLLPADRDYYRFNGSLTTPPCTEGVRWLVLKHPVSASRKQVEAFAQLMHHPNNRPLQPVNARPLLK